MDIKNSQNAYTKTSGKSNFNLNAINQSVELLKSGIVPYEFRTTLIKGHHTLTEIEQIANWLAGAQKLYLQCFVNSGNCVEDGCEKLDKQTAEKFKNILEKKIKVVKLRGY